MRRALRRAALWALLLQLVVGSIFVVCKADAPPAANAPFLWKIHGRTVDHYLIGSVHLLPEAADTLPPELDQAYAAAKTVIFETDIDALESQPFQASILAASRAPAGIEAEIGHALYARTQARLIKTGMPATFCDALRAWFCAVALELTDWQRAGFVAGNGIDLQLNARAITDGKTRRWFEAPAAHMALLTGMPQADVRELLASTLDDNSPDGDPVAIYKAWRDDDTATIAREVADFRRQSPRLYARLLRNRNLAWRPMLRQLMEAPDPQLIVVGAAHCVGPDGLLSELREAGYLPVAVPAMVSRRP